MVMGFGLAANYETTIPLQFDRALVREAIVKTLDGLGWRHEMRPPDRFTAKVRISGLSWGERVSISIEPGALEVKSECYPVPQLYDWGKNKRNVEAFLDLYSAKLVSVAKFSDAIDRPAFDTSISTPLERVLKDS